MHLRFINTLQYRIMPLSSTSPWSQRGHVCSCRVKGFDSKWTVSEAPKKKDGWEEVLIKGAKGKKQLSGAEKRGEANFRPNNITFEIEFLLRELLKCLYFAPPPPRPLLKTSKLRDKTVPAASPSLDANQS